MGKSLQIERSPKWIMGPLAISFLIWISGLIGGAGILYKLLKAPVSLPNKIEAALMYLGGVVCAMFTWRLAGAVDKATRGKLKVLSVSLSTKALSIAACLASSFFLLKLLTLWSLRFYVGSSRGIHFLLMIVFGIFAFWIVFLTLRIAFGKTNPPSAEGEPV